jgi:hypothetical protein
LEGESVRDYLLEISGQLNRTAGGPGFQDVQLQPLNGTTYYEPIDPVGPEFNRRTVYRFTPRGGRSALLDAFDCPDPAASAPRRNVTTTPLQALSLLNNSLVLRAAERLAQRVRGEVESDRQLQVRRTYELVFTRQPDEEELRDAAQLAADHGLDVLCRALLNSNEFVTVE